MLRARRRQGEPVPVLFLKVNNSNPIAFETNNGHCLLSFDHNKMFTQKVPSPLLFPVCYLFNRFNFLQYDFNQEFIPHRSRGIEYLLSLLVQDLYLDILLLHHCRYSPSKSTFIFAVPFDVQQLILQQVLEWERDVIPIVAAPLMGNWMR